MANVVHNNNNDEKAVAGKQVTMCMIYLSPTLQTYCTCRFATSFRATNKNNLNQFRRGTKLWKDTLYSVFVLYFNDTSRN